MKKHLVFGLMLLLIVLSACSNNEIFPNRKDSIQTENEPSHPAHSSSFVSREDLYYCLAKKDAEKNDSLTLQGQIIGGVVPHHLVAGNLIARFMENLAQNNPEVIVLVGPNHYNLGAKVISGYYDWQTPEGIVKTDKQIVKELLESGLASENEEVMANEHSIGAVVPFIEHFLPDANIVPLILHHDVSLEEVDKILAMLNTYWDEKVVFIGSVDFSHYLSRQEAQEKDEYTLQVMRDFDYEKLYGMSSDYLDSPASLALVFRNAERRGIMDFHVLDNTNSGIILKNDMIETTSYFTLMFEEKMREKNNNKKTEKKN
jgi:AmmeMemoRadiSam system protein B